MTASSAAPAIVLLVEDEASIAESVSYNLEREGFSVVIEPDGGRAIERFEARRPDIVILDLMLPNLSGLDVCRAIRQRSAVPILMLTAKDSEADKVAGLELGADDYVTKPFSIRELVSRVRAQLRRAEMGSPRVPGPSEEEEKLRGGPVEVDPATHEAFVREQRVSLTPKEFELLETMLRRRGRLLSRDFLIERIWGSDYVGDTKTLDVHVKRLRSKIEETPSSPRRLVTIRGLGYKFETPGRSR